MFKVNLPIDVVVQNDCVTETKVTLFRSNTSTSLAKSVNERDTFDAGALLVQLIFLRDVAYPEDLSGSFGHANATATAEAVLKLLKNDAEVGTVTFATGTAAPTFSVSGSLAMAAGDRLAITAPDPADGTLADVTLGLRGVRA